MYQNLHSHTKTSDGQLTYLQVLNICRKNNISAVAFCDHDSLPGKKSLKILAKNRGHPVKWILGIEISSGWPKEIGGPSSNFHIAGLFVDPNNKELKKHCLLAKKSRRKRMEGIVKNLKSLGFKISVKQCLKQSRGETIGRPHIVAALTKEAHNLKIIRALRLKMARQSRKDKKIKEKYSQMLKQGPDQYPYALFLEKESFIPGIYVDYPYWLDMDKSVELIRQAGGLAILAHWSFSKQKVDKKMIAKFFKEKRLDGAEIVFGADRAINLQDKEIIKDMKTMKRLTQKYGAVQSGGGDTHKKEDFAFFASQDWFAKETIGLAEKMIALKRPPLEFSSF